VPLFCAPTHHSSGREGGRVLLRHRCHNGSPLGPATPPSVVLNHTMHASLGLSLSFSLSAWLCRAHHTRVRSGTVSFPSPVTQRPRRAGDVSMPRTNEKRAREHGAQCFFLGLVFVVAAALGHCRWSPVIGALYRRKHARAEGEARVAQRRKHACTDKPREGAQKRA
jgi:hypothetical protein